PLPPAVGGTAMGFSVTGGCCGVETPLAWGAEAAGAAAGLPGCGAGGAATTALPSASITPTTVLTCTVAPAATLISLRTPAAGAGISASTLSVEISKRGSSRCTLSPGCLSHLVMVPSKIDSPIWGMTTSVGMEPFPRMRTGWLVTRNYKSGETYSNRKQGSNLPRRHGDRESRIFPKTSTHFDNLILGGIPLPLSRVGISENLWFLAVVVSADDQPDLHGGMRVEIDKFKACSVVTAEARAGVYRDVKPFPRLVDGK